MGRKRLGPGGTAKTVGVTVSPVDYNFLECLAAELAFKRKQASVTTSEAVRTLIRKELERRQHRIVEADRQTNSVLFVIGRTASEDIVRRLDVDTGEVDHLIRRGRKIESRRADGSVVKSETREDGSQIQTAIFPDGFTTEDRLPPNSDTRPLRTQKQKRKRR